MKQCSLCKQTLPDEMNYCIHCGGKVIPLVQKKDTHPICPQCNKENPSENNFCIFCGSKMHTDIDAEEIKASQSISCGQCGTAYADVISFCRHCGADMKPPEQNQDMGVVPKTQKAELLKEKEKAPLLNGNQHKKKPRWIWVLIPAVLIAAILLIVQLTQHRPVLPGRTGLTADIFRTVEPLTVTSLQLNPDYTPEQTQGIAGEWIEQREVDLKQECRIEFNTSLWSSAENKKHISVTRWDGKPVETTLKINRNILTIQPVEAYEEGQYYRLNIAWDLRSDDGGLLVEPLSLSFVTKVVSESTPLVSETLKPSDKKQEITAPDGLVVVIPGGLLEKEEQVEISTITGGHLPMVGLDTDILKTYEIQIGDMKSFAKPLYLEIPIVLEKLPGSLKPEHALKACYWDEQLYCWVDAYALVDTENQKLIIPTNHLTKWSALAVKTDGHIYNEYFSMYYSGDELKKAEEASLTNFVTEDYIDAVFDAFNEAKEKYEQAGFRQLEKFQAIREVYVAEYPKAIPVPYYNIYLTGAYDDNATRNKYTGNITIPVDHYNGVNHFQIAHELFHSFQNRYYYALGMTELGVPLTTSPSNQLLSRQWWLEGSADYAAGRIAYPVDNKPNPDMGGILNAKHLEKPLTHSPTALAFWAPEDRHSYNNAWFFEFMVQSKKVDFTNLFETVASYYNPSIYNNLVSYFKQKNLNFNEIYSDYALWWFSSPQSPLTDGNRDNAMDKSIVMDYPANYTYSFLFPEWHFDNKHTTRALKLTGKQEDSEDRLIILSYKDGAEWSTALDIKSFLLPENKRQAVTARGITPGNYTVYGVSPKDALYILVINNEGHIWEPEVKIHEADLTYTYAPREGSHEFSIVGSNIPAFLEEGISIVLQVDGKDAAIDRKPDVEVKGDTITIQSFFNVKEIEEYRLDLKIVTGKQEIIAQKNIKEKEVSLKINPPQIEKGKLNTEYLFELDAKQIPERTKKIEFLWNMGDGGKESTGSAVMNVEKGSAKTSVSYRFSAVDTKEEAYRYQVQIQARDADTGEELAKTSASVTIPKPTVVITAPRSMRYEMKDGATSVKHTFDAYVKNAGDDIYRFVWNFDDGSAPKEEKGTECQIGHLYQKMGAFYPSVTLYGADGSALSTDSITVILEAAGSQTTPVKNGNDPYRKYDEGFVGYDYSRLAYHEFDYLVAYYNIKTNIEEGMRIDFYDAARTRPKLVTYTIPEDRTEYNTPHGLFDTYGVTSYYENGRIENQYHTRYTAEGKIATEIRYTQDGVMYFEQNYKDDKKHGKTFVRESEGEYLNLLPNTLSRIVEENYSEGKLHGTCRYSFYAEQDEIPEWYQVFNYKDGQKHGECLSYLEDGRLFKQEYFENDLPHGEYIQYNPDLANYYLINKIIWNMGNMVEEWSYFHSSEGKVYLDEYSIYHSNGRVKTRTKYRSDGSVRSITNYNTDGEMIR